MKDKRKVILYIFKYVILFTLFLFGLLVSYNIFFGDSIANLGFSYAITKGEIPYNHFNLVIPLFSPFFYAIPLFLFKSSLTFYITQAVLLTFLFYLLQKSLGHKVSILFMIICFAFPLSLVTALFPGYNFLLFLFIVLLGYLEEKKANDFVIGIILGLCILTKHTIGIFLLLPSFIFYYKDFKKLFQRLIGLFIPNFIFLIYLLCTKSFFNFLNLCVLGLFDFASKNSSFHNIFLIMIAIGCFIYFIYVLFKSWNIKYFYLFLTFLFIITLFDEYHLSYFVISTLFVLLDRCNISKVFLVPSCLITFILIGIWTVICFNYSDYHFVNYSYYPLRYMSSSMEKDYEYLDNVYQKYKKINLFLLGTENYFYKMNHHLKINYYDLPHYGNYGYDSFNRMKKIIDKESDSYFVINVSAIQDGSNNKQYYKELAKYIMDTGEFVESNKDYAVYYFR